MHLELTVYQTGLCLLDISIPCVVLCVNSLVNYRYPAVSHFEVVQALVDASKGYKEVNAGTYI